jgi:hypothetical protein
LYLKDHHESVDGALSNGHQQPAGQIEAGCPVGAQLSVKVVRSPIDIGY